MNDNDIIKALECCMLNKECEECPLCRTLREPCRVVLAREAFDIINRQKAGIERLQEYYKLYFERERDIEELNAQVEHLNGNLKFVRGTAERQLDEIEKFHKTLGVVQREQYTNGRNDGIKEFAGKLKGKFEKPCAYTLRCIDSRIDNLVKEMTEEGNESIS